MKEFQWTGKKEGIVVRGSLESESLDDAIAILKGREIEVEELVENDQRSTSATQSKSEHDNDKSTSTSTKLIDVLDQCEFLNGLSEKKKHRFQEKLKARLKKSIGLNPDQDLSAVEVDEVNVDKIKSTIQSTVSFSWLGLFLTLPDVNTFGTS